jgi:hypothetical protein
VGGLADWMLQAQAGLSRLKGYIVETWFSVLALILGATKVTIMWLSYKENKEKKNTDCD